MSITNYDGYLEAIAAGIAKECYDDWNKDGSWDWKDALTTWVGGACGFALVSLISYWRS